MEHFWGKSMHLDQKIIEQVHETGQQILDEFSRICEANRLKYYLIAGSLLGAVRHQGPIPWDDDIDVAMPRNDFEHFKELMLARPESEPFHIHCFENDPCFRLFVLRLNKSGTLYSLHHEKNVDLKYKELWIDIFPLDDAPVHNKMGYQLLGKRIAVMKRMVNNRVRNSYEQLHFKGKILHFLLSFFSYEGMRIHTEKLMKSWNGKAEENYVSWASHYDFKKQTMPQGWYEPAQKVYYSGKLYRAPKEWDKVLRQLYGDYMKLPPEEQRRGHVPFQVKL